MTAAELEEARKHEREGRCCVCEGTGIVCCSCEHAERACQCDMATAYALVECLACPDPVIRE